MRTLNKYDLQKLEEYWTNHETNKRLLKYREFELSSKNNADENTGGGRSGISNPTEQLGMKLLNDNLYQNLKKITTVVDRLYKATSVETRTIIDMRYWDKENNCYEWEDIASELELSRNKVLRLRNALLDDMAELIGWV